LEGKIGRIGVIALLFDMKEGGQAVIFHQMNIDWMEMRLARKYRMGYVSS
jgi:hypothetical protein